MIVEKTTKKMKENHLKTNKDAQYPVLVYQMGKTGGSTIAKSLKQYGIACFHDHGMLIDAETRRILRENPQKMSKWHKRNLPVAELIDSTWGQVRWKIITAVREPVSRFISSVFQNMRKWLPEVQSMSFDEAYQSILTYILDCLDTYGGDFTTPFTWFDSHLKSIFHLDVYESSFCYTKGYQIYASEHADVLLYRLEDLNRCCQEAFDEFLGIDHFELYQKNITNQKGQKTLYSAVKSNLKIDSETLSTIYSLPYSQHFYTDSERAAFISQWIKTPAEKCLDPSH